MSGSPVSEEAARLVEAVQEWLAGATSGLSMATGGPECKLCPFCQLLRMLRTTRPEVFEHLAGAGVELVAALRATVEAHEREWRSRPDRVEHIDVND